MTRRYLLFALSAAAALLGGYLLYGVLQRYEFRDVARSLQSLSPWHIAYALALTFASFACIAAMEALAVRYAERGRPQVTNGRIVRTTIAALGIGHSIGLSALSSGAVRYRMYSRVGLDLVAVGEIIVFSGISVGLGLGLVGGLSLFWHGEALAKLLDVTLWSIYAMGAAGLALCGLYILACALARHPLQFGRYRLRLPSWRIALAQMAISGLNYACLAGVMYYALAGLADAPYSEVASLYIGSEISALIAHVPGSWGVLEYVFTQTYHGHGVVGGLLVFRTIYYLLPLVAGLLAWLFDEIGGRRLTRQERQELKTQNA